MTKLIPFAAALAAVALLLACHDDDEHGHSNTTTHTSDFPSCQAIIDACHPLDVGEGPIHDCHDVAHDATSDQACAAKKAECLKTCVATDAGAVDAAAATDAPSGG